MIIPQRIKQSVVRSQTGGSITCTKSAGKSLPDQSLLNVGDFINEQKVGSFQVQVAVICFMIVAIDGFDTATIGFLAPAIRTEWNLTPLQLAPLFGAGLFGLMIGAFVFGPLSDRYGGELKRRLRARRNCLSTPKISCSERALSTLSGRPGNARPPTQSPRSGLRL